MYANPLVKSAAIQQGFRSLTEASVVPRGINVCSFFLLFSFALFFFGVENFRTNWNLQKRLFAGSRQTLKGLY